ALLRLEVYDLNGRRMLAQDCQGHSATIDASSWPEGTYIAIVRTPAGATSQKLTIKR
ncbi:MAG: T9SS type A sorting domain-containing protein, partial [Bacteroidales bacterium]|nr:T9SS type A sorting domain-containing protein [Bacteroidales bacterium]